MGDIAVPSVELHRDVGVQQETLECSVGVSQYEYNRRKDAASVYDKTSGPDVPVFSQFAGQGILGDECADAQKRDVGIEYQQRSKREENLSVSVCDRGEYI